MHDECRDMMGDSLAPLLRVLFSLMTRADSGIAGEGPLKGIDRGRQIG